MSIGKINRYVCKVFITSLAEMIRTQDIFKLYFADIPNYFYHDNIVEIIYSSNYK